MIPPQTEAFVDGLFGQCKLAKQPMFLTLSAIHPTLPLPRPSRHIPLGNTKALHIAMESLLCANEAGWGAYLGIAPRRPGLSRWQRGRKDDLVALPALFIDIDVPKPNILDTLQRFVLPPSCIVNSGSTGNLHVYWYLAVPSPAFTACEQAMRGLAALFGGDPVSSAAHSLRIPQTRNTKHNRNTLCEVIWHNPEWRYPLNEFFKHLPAPDTRLIPNTPRPFCLPDTGEILSKERIQEAKRNVLDAVIQRLDGVRKANGFWACLCPCGHNHDRPGMHFNFAPSAGVGKCFGRHGRLNLVQMASLLGVSI